METPSVGIREFRASLAEYIDTDAPVTITRLPAINRCISGVDKFTLFRPSRSEIETSPALTTPPPVALRIFRASERKSGITKGYRHTAPPT
jgi:hypothetical protein